MEGLMARILLQTTIVDDPDDWNVERFSLLAEELRKAGHEVMARNRENSQEDPVLSRLDTEEYDQLWLMAVDVGDGLGPGEASGIVRFRERGGGVLTARDHQDLGSSLRGLGSIGELNHFHTENPDSIGQRDDLDNLEISWPNFHSGANGNYQRAFGEEPIHELLRTTTTPSGQIEWFPAHPHEGAVVVPPKNSFARSVASGRSAVTGRTFNLAVSLEGERTSDGRLMGRVVAESTFHHFADLNWDADRGAPSFVTELPGDQIKNDPSRLMIFKNYVHNLAQWL
jgi:hypothetical protein